MTALKSLVNVIMEMLREIFDENAYARFLLRESKTASAQAYSQFVKEKYDEPVKRCC